MALLPELSCLSDLSETLRELDDDGDLIKAAAKANELDLKLMKRIIENINGGAPLKYYFSDMLTIKNSVRKITDFINLKVDYDPITHNLYENELYTDCPGLYADRMKDLQYRWRWALPGQVSDPFANCGEGEDFVVPEENIMGHQNSEERSFENLAARVVLINGKSLDDLPWYNSTSKSGIILAGGAVTSALYDENSFSDYDLFLIAKNEADAKKLVIETMKIINNSFENEYNLYVAINEHVITMNYGFIGEPVRTNNFPKKIQIITRLYESPAQVINGFDIDACCVGYCPEYGIFTAKRASRAFKNGWILLDPMCQSPSYEYRLTKYAKRYNLGIYVPLYKYINYDHEYIIYYEQDKPSNYYKYTYYYVKPLKLIYEKGLSLLNTLMNRKFKTDYMYGKNIVVKSDYDKSKSLQKSRSYYNVNLNNIKIMTVNPQSQGKFLSGSISPTYTYDFYMHFQSLLKQVEYEKENVLNYIKKSDFIKIMNRDKIWRNDYRYNNYLNILKKNIGVTIVELYSDLDTYDLSKVIGSKIYDKKDQESANVISESDYGSDSDEDT